MLLGGRQRHDASRLFAAATLLKSKRVPARLDFLVAVPSRQMLEVLGVERAPSRTSSPPARASSSLTRRVDERRALPAASRPGLHCDLRIPSRTFLVEPRCIASAETLAYAVATGEVGDPRTFKRPVRVTVPRVLPTDDVLIARKGERGAATGSASAGKTDPERTAWRVAQTLQLVDSPALAALAAHNGHGVVAVVCTSLDEVRDLAERAPEIAHTVRAVLAPYIPSALVALLSGAGVAAIRIDPAIAKRLKGHKSIALPAPSQWAEGTATSVDVGATQLPLTWLALGAERTWATGPSKPPPSAPTRGRRVSSKQQEAAGGNKQAASSE